jgi:hypothetical protein
MISAVISVIFGFISFTSVPMLLPVIGLALGASSVLEERKRSNRTHRYVAFFGVAINLLHVILFFLFR